MTWKNEKKSKALLVVFGIYLALLVWCILFKFALRPEEIPHLRGLIWFRMRRRLWWTGKCRLVKLSKICWSFCRSASASQPSIRTAKSRTAFSLHRDWACFLRWRSIFLRSARVILRMWSIIRLARWSEFYCIWGWKNLEREDGKDHYHSGSGAGSAVSGVIVFTFAANRMF